VAPSQRPKGGTTRYKRYWDTVGLEVLWGRVSKTVSHEGADIDLNALANRKPVKGVSDERRDKENFETLPAKLAAALRTTLSLGAFVEVRPM